MGQPVAKHELAGKIGAVASPAAAPKAETEAAVVARLDAILAELRRFGTAPNAPG